MIEQAPHPDAARQAALTLHALGETDRAWMLAALPAPERHMLEGLLAELCELGIPRVSGLADPRVHSRQHSALDVLDPAGVRVLASILENEPPGLLRALLTAREWSWRSELLAQLPPAVRMQAQEASVRSGEGGRLAACLVDVLASQVRQALPRAAPRSRRAWTFWRRAAAVEMQR